MYYIHTATCEDGDVKLVGGMSKTEEGLRCASVRDGLLWMGMDGHTATLKWLANNLATLHLV